MVNDENAQKLVEKIPPDLTQMIFPCIMERQHDRNKNTR